MNSPSTSVSRRRFLVGVGATAAALAGVRNPVLAKASVPWHREVFTLGVASGDPTADGVVLWTRLAPEPLAGGGMPHVDVPVRWEVARDPLMRKVVRKGEVDARAREGHSVHVEVEGLEPGREYWYRFIAGPQSSMVGRTVTAPKRGDHPDELRFAFVSCQDWQNGYWPAYRHLADEDLHLVVHLGDYIYEYGPEAKVRPGSPVDRVHEGPEVSGLLSYRNRHALYRTDPALQAAHAAAPWIVTWDDHEVENNYASLIPEVGEMSADTFPARRANAFQAYYEHMPLRRRNRPRADGMHLYRRLSWGRLAEFNVLDTRQYRTDQPCNDGLANCDDRFDPAATMTGAEQEAWLVRGLDRSSARWNVIAQQTIFAEVDFNPLPGSDGPAGLFNVDQWDGYVAQRARLTEFLATRKPSNPVIITGDIHSSWAIDVKVDYDDPTSTTVASELVGTSISSDFPEAFIAPVERALVDNPHIKYFDGRKRGYVVNRLGRRTWTADFRTVDTVDTRDAAVSTARTFVIEDGRAGVAAA